MKNYHPILIWIIAIFVTSAIGFYQRREVGAISHVDGAMNSQQDGNAKPDQTQIEDKSELQIHKNKPEPLIVAKADPAHSNTTTGINEIKKSEVGKRVTVITEIKTRRDHTKGHVFLTVADDTGEILVPVFADKDINTNDLVPGVVCRVSGKVAVYREQLEIIPESQNDVQIVLKGEQRTSPITEDDVGKDVEVTARVLTKYQHPEGHLFLKVLILKTNQEISIPIFKSLGYDPTLIKVDSTLQVKGKVSLYKGKLQIVPGSAKDIQIIDQGDVQEPVLTEINNISNKDVGQMVQVRGFVHQISTGKGHTFFTIEDKRGNSIKAVLFRADSEENVGRKMKVVDAETKGYPIRVLATVNDYKGSLELVVDKVFNEY